MRFPWRIRRPRSTARKSEIDAQLLEIALQKREGATAALVRV